MTDKQDQAAKFTTSAIKRCPSCFDEYPSDVGVCPVDGSALKVVSSDPLVGSLIEDRYRVERLQSRGGFGSVYRAIQTDLDREVAIKVLHKHHLQDADTWKRFQREAKAAAKIAHPNLAAVYAHGILDSGDPYIVMQHFDGIDLSDELKCNGPLLPERALPLFIQVCAALEILHERGIVHRDIKPANIMLVQVQGKEEAKLLDLGLAAIIGEGSTQSDRLTATGQTIGTPAYMSPEQCQGLKVDARSDVYSLGCVLYEALTGKPLVCGSTQLDVMQKHVVGHGNIKMSSPGANPKVMEQLASVIEQAVAAAPAERFDSVRQLSEALEAVLSGKSPNLHHRKPRRQTVTLVAIVAAVFVIILGSWGGPGILQVVTPRQEPLGVPIAAPEAVPVAPAADNVFVPKQSHANRQDVDPEIKALLAGLEKAGGAKLAEQIQQQIDRFVDEVSSRSEGHVVVGRVVVADGRKAPTAVVSQAPIQEGGYFVSSVANFKNPIGFRLHGYKPVDLELNKMKLTHHVAWIGRITMEPSPPNELGTIVGTIKGNDKFDPRTAKVALSIEPDPINTPGNGFYGSGPDWETFYAQADRNGKFSFTGCSRLQYFLYVTAPGRVSQWKLIDVNQDTTKVEPLVLDVKQGLKVSYVTQKGDDLTKLSFAEKPAERKLKAEDWFPQSDSNYDLKIEQKNGKLGFYSFYYPVGLADLGTGELSQFRRFTSLPNFAPNPAAVALQAGHVYLHSQHFPKQHYTLFKVQALLAGDND